MPQSLPTPYPVRIFRCLRLALHFAWIGFGTAVIYRFTGERQQLRLKQLWSRRILQILSVRLDAPPADTPSGCLIVANHVSWLDIFAINAVRPASFIAKAEVRRWPFIGWLSARNDTVFLHRGSRQHARIVNTEIDARLDVGRDVAIFPEGRTTDGTHMLEFHAALLQPAIETGRPILPVALTYRDEQGNPSLAPAFADATTLPQCFAAILACRSLTVRLALLPEIATAGKSRRDVSQAAHDAIATRLGFPPSNRAPGIPRDPPA